MSFRDTFRMFSKKEISKRKIEEEKVVETAPEMPMNITHKVTEEEKIELLRDNDRKILRALFNKPIVRGKQTIRCKNYDVLDQQRILASDEKVIIANKPTIRLENTIRSKNYEAPNQQRILVSAQKVIIVLNNDAIDEYGKYELCCVYAGGIDRSLGISDYTEVYVAYDTSVIPNEQNTAYVAQVHHMVENIMEVAKNYADNRDTQVQYFEKSVACKGIPMQAIDTENGGRQYTVLMGNIVIAQYTIGPRGGIYVNKDYNQQTGTNSIYALWEYELKSKAAAVLYPEYARELKEFYRHLYIMHTIIETNNVKAEIRVINDTKYINVKLKDILIYSIEYKAVRSENKSGTIEIVPKRRVQIVIVNSIVLKK